MDRAALAYSSCSTSRLATLVITTPRLSTWMHTAPREYAALAVAPLASGRLNPPDIALFYATPGAMMYFLNGLQDIPLPVALALAEHSGYLGLWGVKSASSESLAALAEHQGPVTLGLDGGTSLGRHRC